MLKLYDHKSTVESFETRKDLIAWLWGVTRNRFIDDTRKTKPAEENHNIETPCFDQDQEPEKDTYQLLQEAHDQLTEIESLWLQTYLDSDLNYSEVQRVFNISRRHAAKRITEIKNKIK